MYQSIQQIFNKFAKLNNTLSFQYVTSLLFFNLANLESSAEFVRLALKVLILLEKYPDNFAEQGNRGEVR